MRANPIHQRVYVVEIQISLKDRSLNWMERKVEGHKG